MDRIELYQKLPVVVREYLFDNAKETEAAVALAKHKLDKEVVLDILLLADDVVLKLMLIADLQKKIIELGKVEPATALAIVKDLIGWRLLPLAEFLPELGEEIKRLGIDPAQYPIGAIKKPKVTIEEFLRQVLTEANLTLSSAELQNRLEFLLNSYLRGVRTRPQIIATMGRSLKVGGLEIDETRAGKLLDVIDAKKGEMVFDASPERTAVVDVIAQAATSGRPYVPSVSDLASPSFKQHMEEQRQAQAVDKAKLTERDTQDLAKRYAVLTGKVGEAVAAPTVARASIAISKHEELTRSAVKVDATAKAVMTQAAPRPAPVLPKLSEQSLPPAESGQRPQMADVKYNQKLVGPTEELKNMTLVDFHRLGSDPDQAVMKIQDKIELLKGESYEKMVAGIKAWRESAVNKMYVAISGEALRAGKSVVTVAGEWKAAGKETLTPEEVKAIVRLNTSLRF